MRAFFIEVTRHAGALILYAAFSGAVILAAIFIAANLIF